jgi:hypothetical protein
MKASPTDPRGAPRTKRLRQWRRSRLQPVWLALRPVTLLVLVLLVLVLGTIGYSQLEKPGYSAFDSFYLALGLFTLGGDVTPPVPVELQVARIVAPIVTGYAVVQAVLALFREKLQLLHIRLFRRRHVVMAGLGVTGSRLASALDEAGYSIVAVDSDLSSPALAACRERGVSAIAGDATDKAVLQRAQLRRARYLVVACGDDRVDMDVAAAAADVSATRRTGALTTFVALDDLKLWRTLSARMLARTGSPSYRLELFQMYEVAARMLLERHPAFPTGERPEGAHAVLVGLEGVSESLVLHLARLWLGLRSQCDDRLPVTLIGPDAERESGMLRLRYPGLRKVCELRPCSLQLESEELARGVADAETQAGPITSVYVCCWDESEALASALALGALPGLAGVTVVVTVMDADAGIARAIERSRRADEDVQSFGVVSGALTPELLFGGAYEILARAKHEDYVLTERAKGKTSATNPQMVGWDELSDDYKEENRAFAADAGRKLESVGRMIVPAPLADLEGSSLTFSEDEIERLAIEEHNRWWKSRKRAGWSYGAIRDEERKLHPSMVEWERLSKEEQDKDRQPVRDLPKMLARAGFETMPVSTVRAPAARVHAEKSPPRLRPHA